MQPGDRVHMLTLVERVRIGRRAGWVCRCDCGGMRTHIEHNLQKANVSSCGCSHRRRGGRAGSPWANRSGGKAHVGARFGRLVVTALGTGVARRVICDCGVERDVLYTNLLSGATRSCGCLARETAAQLNRTHGGSSTRLYFNWQAMIKRCTSTEDANFDRYGGRGIDVCDGWTNSFSSFRAHMGERPSSKHSIDRVDNDRGYHCGRCLDCKSKGQTPNCRWATQTEQARNTRRNIWITVGAETLLLMDWSRRSGLSRQLISMRLKSGWEPARAVTEPANAEISARSRIGRLATQARRRAA